MSSSAKIDWGRRVINSYGGGFRIEAGNPTPGRDGPEPSKIVSQNDNGEVLLIAHGHGSGLGRIACDKSIEINAGAKNAPNTIDIRISATTGDITITAPRGRIRMQAKDLMFVADRDIDLNAGRNVNIHSSCGRTLIKANSAECIAKKGNLSGESFLMRVCKNSHVPDDTKAKLDTNHTQPGAGPGGDLFGNAGGAVPEVDASTIPGITAQTGGIEAFQSAATGALNEFQKVSNYISNIDLNMSVGDALLGQGAGGILDKVTTPLDTPLGKIVGDMPGMDVIRGIGDQVLAADGVSNLNAAAQKLLGVTQGGNAPTGLQGMVGTGLGAIKGAASLLNTNNTSDPMSSLPSPGTKPIESVAGALGKLQDEVTAAGLNMVDIAGDLQREGNITSDVETLLKGGIIGTKDPVNTSIEGSEIIRPTDRAAYLKEHHSMLDLGG